MIFLVGCTSKAVETVFIEPKKFEFVPIDVNVSEVSKAPVIYLEGKIKFLNDSNKSIVMSVDTWLQIRDVSEKKKKIIIRLRRHKLMYRKALNGVNRQIRRYLNASDRKTVD